MSNSYKYIDPDFTYTDPTTGLLRNLQDITDPDMLLFVESGAVTKRLQELYEHPIKIKGIDSLFEIHSEVLRILLVAFRIVGSFTNKFLQIFENFDTCLHKKRKNDG